MDQYIIPANSKKSLLIFNMFRGVDLIIFSTGAVISLFFLFIIPGNGLWDMLLKLAPVLITLFLVLPIPNYHNTLVLIRELMMYYTNRRIYIWKGWCVLNDTDKK